MTLEKLTDCEQLVMKTVWDAAEELGLTEIMQRVNDKYCKEWKSQTVSTFLARLVKKGYLRHFRKGRVFYYQILVSLDEYRTQLTKEYVDFWFRGNEEEFLTCCREISIIENNRFMKGVSRYAKFNR